MEQQVLGETVAGLLKLGIVTTLLLSLLIFFWRENVRLIHKNETDKEKWQTKYDHDIIKLQEKLDQKEDFILQETKANLNVLVHSMQTMEKLNKFLDEHAKDNVALKEGQRTIVKMLENKFSNAGIGKKPN